MNKEDFLNYIINFAMDTEWDNLKGREQLRALFTSWCFIHGVDADTKECDSVLGEIYWWKTSFEEQCSYIEFEQYMVELIV